MDHKIIEEKNENGLYTKHTVTTQTPEDGFVNQRKHRTAVTWSEVNSPPKNVWFKGHAVKYSRTTNDPRITRPFVYGICGIFFAAGIFMLLRGDLFFGIILIAFSVAGFRIAKQDIDRIEENLRQQGHDMDSPEKADEVQQTFAEGIKGDFNQAASTVFTKRNINSFIKKGSIFYFFIIFLTSILLTAFVNILLGIFTLILTTGMGILFFYFIKKLGR